MATQRSLLSKIVLVGVCSAAAAGWFGVRLDPQESAQAVAIVDGTAQPGVRNRDAWQPSPMPSQSQVVVEAGVSPSARNRTAWQPSPIPNNQQSPAAPPAAPSLPSLSAAPPMGGAPVAQGVPLLPAPAARSSAAPPRAPLAAPAVTQSFTPLSAMFTADRLEALFDGELPEVRGEWREVSFYSRALGRETAYLIWLPPGYDSGRQTYPTLYLLHGAGGDEGFGVEEWLGYGLTENLDRLLALGWIKPMIVVLPNGEQDYWMNHANGGPRWTDYVAIDLVKHVDATFRTEPARERRAIGGLSMGAHGALQIALNHPNVFSIAGAHSPTIRPFEDSPEFFGDRKWFARYDPVSLVKNTDAARKLAIWIDLGHEDEVWRLGAEQLRRALLDKKVSFDFHVLEGEHEGWYWTYYLPEYLNYYSTALYATAKTAHGAPVVVSRPLATIAGVDAPRS